MTRDRSASRRSLRSLVAVGCAAALGAAAVVGAGASARAVGPAAAGAEGRCSKATAIQVADRLRFGQHPARGLPTPVDQVLCGPLFGRGTSGMVVSVATPRGCAASVEWGVLRYASGRWRLVLDRRNGAFLSLVGSGIRERQGAPAASDPLCHPSAWKSRVWHWNGSRFTASPWRVTQPRLVHLDHFLSPSHNLWCNVGDEDIFHCSSGNRPHSVSLTRDGVVSICDPCAVNTKLYDTGRPVAGSPVLGYGHTNEIGFYRCLSQTKGMTCTVFARGKGHGKGFLINADGVTKIG